MFQESDAVTVLKGVGEKTARALEKAGIGTVGDLLHFYPVRYDCFGEVIPIAEAPSGEICTLRGEFAGPPQNTRSGSLIRTTVSLRDGTGTVRLTWFRMPYLKNSLHPGEQRLVRGKLMRDRYGVRMDQPKLYTEEEYETLKKGLQPVYPAVEGVPAKTLIRFLHQALDGLAPVKEALPEDIRERCRLAESNFALRVIHFPRDETERDLGRRRLVFDEFFFFILRMRRWKKRESVQENPWDFSRHSLADRLIEALPYELTGAQKRVWEEIYRDLTGPGRMNRLIQGDVGCGKTILAVLALITAAENGYQGAIMAPTEVLASQHFATFTDLFARYGIPVRCVLLTGSMTAKQKRETYEVIARHETDLIVGTHALIQEKAVYDDLALVITDEQHRFGVRQREELAEKGESPHILVMSATPIPRTLAIILYGDLDLSAVDEMPPNHRPVRSCVIGPSQRPKACDFIRRQVESGKQAYVICPLVEESEGLDAQDVKNEAEWLKENLPPDIRIETLHGRMNPKEKNSRMEAFLRGEIQVLVSTTVVEVGVNVPNAAVMMIENAERFGLAELHQLRGRVGRGSDSSYCIFVDSSGENGKNSRLKILAEKDDGFEIAAEDLKSRGPGDFFGVRQSGDFAFKIGDIYRDAQTLEEASQACDEILARDPDLSRPEDRILAERLTEHPERELNL